MDSVQRILVLFTALAILVGCETQPGSSLPNTNKPIVNIGRLICGGHLPLAIVEKRFQQDLKTFQLKTIQNHDWNDVVDDMRSGKLAGTFILSPLAMDLIRNGLEAKIVLKADRNGNSFVLSNKFRSINDPNRTRSIIAVPHLYSQHHVLLRLALDQHNVDHNKISVVAMPPRDMINSMKQGEIDGFVVGEPEANKSISMGEGWMAAISPEIWKDHMDHVFIASDHFIEGHPEQLQELVNVLVKSGQFIESNPKISAAMGEDYTGSAASVFEKVLTTPPDWIDYSDMMMTEKDLQQMSEKMVEMRLWDTLPVDMTVYYDNRFLNKALSQSLAYSSQ